MKGRITIQKDESRIHFYLTIGHRRFFLFSQKFSKGVFDFFHRGRSENEVLQFKGWHRNPRLDKTISKIPMYARYVRYPIMTSDVRFPEVFCPTLTLCQYIM